MKIISLKSMHLVNFRGAKDREIEFGKVTTIAGDNGTGKSTIFDAFTWLLFGKDQFDRKDYEITPVVDGKKLTRVDSEVSAVIDVDMCSMSLRRVFHPKWVRRRGQSIEEFDGFETRYFANDVPLKMSEFNAKVDSMIDGTIFKFVTNPLYFFTMMKWQDQRSILFQMAGSIDDAELARKKPEFAALLDQLSGRSWDEFRREIAARKRKLNEELKVIPTKIDQTRRLMPESQDWATLESQKADIDAQIEKIDTTIADKVKANRNAYEEIRAIQKEITKCESERDRMVEDAKSAELKRVREANAAEDARVEDANAERNRLERAISNAKRDLEIAKSNIRSIDVQISNATKEREELMSEREDLLQQWTEINQRTFVAGVKCVMCPLFHKECTDPAAADRADELNRIGDIEFKDRMKKDLDKVNQRGMQIKQRVADIDTNIQALTQSKAEIESSIMAASRKIEEDTSVLDSMAKVTPAHCAPAEVVPASIHGWSDLGSKIEELKAKIQEPAEVDTTELQNRKRELMGQRDDIASKLNNKSIIEKYTGVVADLERTSEDLSQQIADVEKTEFTIAYFIHTRTEECESRINGLFKLVNWKLFDKTNAGDEFECCVATNKSGVLLSATNTADQYNCGIDIINALCHYYGVMAPIFIDNRESVSSLIESDSQIINLKKVEGVKTIEVSIEK